MAMIHLTRRRFVALTTACLAAPAITSAGARLQPTGALITRWAQDPFALGSYSYLARGASSADRRALAKPVADRLFFAGEATDVKNPSTVHGALHSGRRAARQIIATGARRIAVIGAGFAGLGAAQILAQAGLDVRVIEARPRIGGRVWTAHDLGLPLDLGASWIHGPNDNPLTNLSNDLGVPRKVSNYESISVRGQNGRRYPESAVEDWLWEATEVQNEYGADRNQLARGAFEEGGEFGGRDQVFPGGYDQLIPGLTGGYRITTGRAIRAVTLSDTHVMLSSSAGPQQFDAVLITVPLGVLKSGAIRFTPALPVLKRAAISRLGMGVLDKLYLKFDHVFWDRNVDWMVYNTPKTNPYPSWLNLAKITGHPVLMSFAGGRAATRRAAQSDQQIVAGAMAALRDMYEL